MRGQKTPGSGRQKGTPNRATREVRALAQEHGPASIELLVAVRDDPAEDTRARLYAATELLNRGFGRPSVDVNVQMQQANDQPDYFAWLPEKQLQIITRWLADAKAAMRRGDQKPGAFAPRAAGLLPAPVQGEVIDVEPVGSAAPGNEPTGEPEGGNP